MLALLSLLLGVFSVALGGSARSAAADSTGSSVDSTGPEAGKDETDPHIGLVENLGDQSESQSPTAINEEHQAPDPTPQPIDPVAEQPSEDDGHQSEPTQLDSSGGDEPNIDDSDGTSQEAVDIPVVYASLNLAAGRAYTFEVDDGNALSVRVTSLPDIGHVSINPDNTLSVVLADPAGIGTARFEYEVTHADGTVTSHSTTIEIGEGSQEAGWGQGNFYMLETDAAGDVVVEAGEGHRPVYVSNSEDALTIEDIAALEGVNPSIITLRWLEENPEYGGSEGMALSSDIGLQLWDRITDADRDPTSHWLLFERGYEYDGTKRIIGEGTDGQSPLNPLHVTAWGEGDRPILQERLIIFQDTSENIVFTDLVFAEGVNVNDARNILLDDVKLTGDESIFKATPGLTIRNSEIVDVYRETDRDKDGVWEAAEDRISGLYVTGGPGLLIEGNLFDHNGWNDEDGGQPPSMFSHNAYLQYTTSDVTFRDNIVLRGASFGVQMRGGGFAEDNAFIDNNAAANFLGGDYDDHGPIGNYTLFTDNVLTSGATKDGSMIGGRGYGFENNGEMTTMLDNIIAHLADPANPEELAASDANARALYLFKEPLYEDTIIFNWIDGPARAAGRDWSVNAEGLDPAVLNQTTIQVFAASLLGTKTATIADLADFLRAQAEGAFDDEVDADLIVRFFQTGFGIAANLRLDPATLRFVPDTLGDGTRWDNRLNWETEDLPGAVPGDSVDLGGNSVRYGGTTKVEDLDLGSGGRLHIGHGKLSVNGELSAGELGGVLNVDGTGQLWISGYSDEDRLDLSVSGGRFVNMAEIDGNLSIKVTGGQALLATGGAVITFDGTESLHIVGNDAKVGFDGKNGDIAVLSIGEGADLIFEADGGALGRIGEYDSGAYGDMSSVRSGINLDGASLKLALGQDLAPGLYELASADEIIGGINDIHISGLASDLDAIIRMDYANDNLSLELRAEGSGQASFEAFGDQIDAEPEIWDVLTGGQGTYSDTPPDPTQELHDDIMQLLES